MAGDMCTEEQQGDETFPKDLPICLQTLVTLSFVPTDIGDRRRRQFDRRY